MIYLNYMIQNTLHLYNTAKRKTTFFKPINQNEVTVYTCGPTVYDLTTIGNMRSYVFADILRRTLVWNNYRVKSTINFTDFGHLSDDADAGEDKILKALKKSGLPLTLESMRNYTDRYIKKYKEDTVKLNIIHPTTYARASDFVLEQIETIAKLNEKNHTYTTSDGVYFDISTFPEYGKLGNIDIKSLKSGARIKVNIEKKHPADFALWKFGDLGWDSPWGKGFPGWHIECSTMAISTLGESIDIHTGGVDHIHTHHNAEIAQSECITQKTFANYWLHNAFVTINNTKISKSLGNVITVPDLEEKGYNPLAYRYWLLTSHYRSQINFNYSSLKQASYALRRLYYHYYEEYKARSNEQPDLGVLCKFTNAINQDLNTPQAISIMWQLIRSNSFTSGTKIATLREMDDVLGVGLNQKLEDGLAKLHIKIQDRLPKDIDELIKLRDQARANKNWPESDRIRDLLKQKGYTVEDTDKGTRVLKLSH